MIETSRDYINNLIKSKQFVFSKRDINDKQIVEYLYGRIKSIKKKGLKIILLAGGAACGTSTLAKIISERLESADHTGTYDYLKGDRVYRWEHFEGSLNQLEKYDFDLLKKKIIDIVKLRERESVRLPVYNEITGVAVSVGEENFPHKVKKINYLIIEGDFFPIEKQDLVIYMHVPDNVRLRNRVNRDIIKRSAFDPQKTEKSFKVRQKTQHFPFTLPIAKKSDYLIKVVAKDKGEGFKYSYPIYRRR